MSECQNDDVSPCKEAKIEKHESINACLSSLDGYCVEQKLNESSKVKTICLEGKFPGYDSSAIVFLEKTPFTESDIEGIISKETSVSKVFHNDIYGKYDCSVQPANNGIKMTVIHPATEKHIEKYKRHNMYFVEETADDYENITKPYLMEQQLSVKWVYNILEHKAETERVLLEDEDLSTGFILIPDLKWSQKDVEDMYLCCICQPRDILSIRELGSQHLPLLKNIRKKCLDFISDKYKLDGNRIRAYFHYQPSYYHLHIHFTHVKYEAPGSNVERAHLLSTVISNIENYPDYYKKSTLTVLLRENDGLYSRFLDSRKEN